jgi:type II secretory pathway component PulF
MRRVAGLALIYPLLVMLLAYVLFVGFLLFVLPPFLSTFDLFRFDARRVLGGLEVLRVTANYWVPVFPCLLLAGVLWWAWSGRARAFPRVGSSPLGWIPGMRGVMNQFAAAGFAELLALLIEHETPLPEAIEMAAGATGDRRLTESARVAAAALNDGRPLPENRREAEGIPALLRWLIAYGSRQGRLAASLRHAAEMYRRRAYLRADLIRTFLPTATMLVVGATVTLLYAMTLFLPFSSLLERIATDL